jgi:hypothetical protein
LHVFDLKKMIWEVVFEEPASPSPADRARGANGMDLNETAPGSSAIKQQLLP